MADSKISALPASTTPLAGTEVLPIVQSSTTKQVSVANLTAGRTQTSNGIVQGTAATGYNFTANTPAPGMTSQLLNWYEEGPFTPTVVGLTTAGTATYAYQYGRYTRIGNRVMFNIYIQWSLHTGTGFLSIAGLPFTTNAASPNYHSVTIGQVSTIPTTVNTIPMALIYNNSTSIRLWETPIGGGATGGVAMTAAANISLSGQYMI